MPDLIVSSYRIVTADGIRPAAIHIEGGVISAVSSLDAIPSGCTRFDAGDAFVIPGLLDTHVHINEPGRTEWEGFERATRAAAAGGVTTLIDMPLNSIPATTTAPALQAKIQAAQGKCLVDVGFWGGVVPGNASELRWLFEGGVFGFKCFLAPSGVDEFPHVTERELRAAMPVLSELGAVLLVHAELPEHLLQANGDPRVYATYLRTRPREAENEAIALIIRLAREFGTRVHIVHLSSSDALGMLRQAKADGLPVTVETCPHYLSFVSEEIPDGATEFKCAPPIRERENRERLWDALAEGLIDFVVTDHSPCPPQLKCRESGDFLRAWGGISSLQLSLPMMWTEACRRGHSIDRLVRWMCRGPAQFAGLGQRKGSIAVGYDADLVVFHGTVEATFLRGRKIEFTSPPTGAILKRGEPQSISAS